MSPSVTGRTFTTIFPVKRSRPALWYTPRVTPPNTEALELVEASRETKWDRPSFALGLFHGRVERSRILPYMLQPEEDRRIGDAYLKEIESFLKKNIDADAVDRDKEIPAAAIQGLAKLGCFGMKIPKEYGGLGFRRSTTTGRSR